MSIKLYRFLFTMRALSRIEFPNFPGVAIRGGLGHMLKRTVCVMDAGDAHSCASCPLGSSCPYLSIFETPPPPGTQVMKKATRCPHPFSITPLFAAPAAFERGERMQIALSLYGDTLKNLAPLTAALNLLGESGLGVTRGRFRIEQIMNAADGTSVREDGKLSCAEAVEQVCGGKAGKVDRLRITFITPCRLVHGRVPVTTADIGIICRSIVRRMSMLAYFYGNAGQPDVVDLSAADGVKKECEHLTRVTVSRYSKRQKKVMPLEGFTGQAVWSGRLDEYYPLLKCGEAVSIGRNTSFGFGAIRVEDISMEKNDA